MKSLGDLLKFHKVPGVEEAEVRKVIAAALTRVLGVPVSVKHIRYSDGVASLQIPPVLKSALVIKFSEVQALLEGEGITLREIR